MLIEVPFDLHYSDHNVSHPRLPSRGPGQDVPGPGVVGDIPDWPAAPPADMLDYPEPPAHSTATVGPRGSALGDDTTAPMDATGAHTITVNAAAQDQTELPTADFRVLWPRNMNKSLNYWQRYIVMYEAYFYIYS